MFKVLFLFSTVLVAAIATPASNDLNHIGVVGGEDADILEFPYMVSLRPVNTTTHYCGGSILNRRTILTAAHCARGKKPNEIEAYVGSTYVDSRGHRYYISKITIHPDYDQIIHAHDIALLVTEKYIKMSAVVRRIGLPTTITRPGATVTLTGWGRKTVYGHTNTLQKISLLTISDEQCKKTATGHIDDTNICTLSQVGKGPCFGDSGSPLAIGNVVVGIFARGMPCANGKPDVYVRVSSYLPWIKKNMP